MVEVIACIEAPPVVERTISHPTSNNVTDLWAKSRPRPGLSAWFREVRKLTFSRSRTFNGFAQGLPAFGKPPHRSHLRCVRTRTGAGHVGTPRRKNGAGVLFL